MKILPTESLSEKVIESWKPALHREGYRFLSYVAERTRDTTKRIKDDIAKGYRGPWTIRRQLWHETDCEPNSHVMLDLGREEFISVPFRLCKGILNCGDGDSFGVFDTHFLGRTKYPNLAEFLGDGWRVY